MILGPRARSFQSQTVSEKPCKSILGLQAVERPTQSGISGLGNPVKHRHPNSGGAGHLERLLLLAP